jgi:hypothetical protein
MMMAVVLRAVVQFIAFSGSLGPSKSTTLGSFGAGSVGLSLKDIFSTSREEPTEPLETLLFAMAVGLLLEAALVFAVESILPSD